MKNLNKNFYKVLILLTFFYCIFTSIHSAVAVVTVWNYTENNVLKTVHGPFTTEQACVDDLNIFTKNTGYTSSTTMCLPSQIAGLPVPQPNSQAPVNIAPGSITTIQNKTTYKFLAPLPGMKTCMDSSGVDKNCIGNNIGEYLNVIFKLIIGICAALAVIMLIINGITYMGDESVFGKTEAKSKMYSAIFGLLIALGAWALLNTINPALTGQGGLSIAGANIEVETQPLTSNDSFTSGTTTTGCPQG